MAPDGDVVSGNSDAPLPVGTSGEVGEYTVTVTAVDADVALTVDLAAAGSPEPTNGRYVLVDLSATYNGADTGNVHTDLLTGLAAWEGAGALQRRLPRAAVPRVDGRAGAGAG